MKNIFASALLLLVLTGCNSTDDPVASKTQNNNMEQNTASNNKSGENGPVCRLEKTIGSNVRRTVCRTRAQIEEEKKEAELAQRDIRRQVGGDINKAQGINR